jgi:hypothetical protein
MRFILLTPQLGTPQKFRQCSKRIPYKIPLGIGIQHQTGFSFHFISLHSEFAVVTVVT